MKKYLQKLLSLLLAVVMVVSMATVGITTASAEGFGSTVMSAIGGRCFKEFTSYCISNQVPYLGGAFYYLLCDPSQRSSIQNTAKINTILSSVTEIYDTLDGMMDQLDRLEDAIEKNHLEDIYRDLRADLDTYVYDGSNPHGYALLWLDYYDVLNNLASADEARAEGNAEEADYYDGLAMEAYNVFIKDYQITYFAGNEYTYNYNNYENTMNSINVLICSEAKDENKEFLPALEELLRSCYPYEHQITEELYAAYEYCMMIQTRIYLIHKEYATYSAMHLEKKDFDKYPKNFFETETDKLEENLENQLTYAGLATLMLPEGSSYDEGSTAPYKIDSTVKINGEDVPCYIIRDNKTSNYFVITQEKEKVSTLVDYKHETWDNLTDPKYYRPSGVLDAEYTDNGDFQMITSLTEIGDLGSDPIGSLRSKENGAGLRKLPENVNYILLYCDEFLGIQKNDDIEWNVKFAKAREYDSNNSNNYESTYSSQAVYEGAAKDMTFVRIYKSIFNDDLFAKNNTLTIDDYQSMPKVISLHNGQTLDCTDVSVDMSECTIIFSGNATIVSNPDVAFKDSQIIVCTDEQITLKNVNVKAAEYKSAIEVRCEDAKIKFEGNNTFNGNGSAVDIDTMLELDTYNYNPVGASHGMLINNDASVTLIGDTATFNGDGGGAGICTWGDLVIDNATIIANGSYEKFNSYYGLYEEFKAPVYSVGAGIGASAVGVKNSKNSTVYLNEKLILGRTYPEYGTVTIKNNSEVRANGAYPEGDTSGSYASDIGGVRFVTHVEGEDVLGWIITDITYTYGSRLIGGGNISDSKVTTHKGNIDKNIAKSNNSYDYDMDTYTVTTSTAGSSGVTSDKISFKLYGTVGGKEVSTNWVTKECGSDKGEYTFVFDDTFIGSEITKIDVKIDGDNGWYPEYIKVESVNGQLDKTFYGGRWLDNSETITLNPTDNVFKIDIKTSNDDNAGTDADVYVQLVDEKGNKTSWINVSNIHPEKNAFEKNDKVSVYRHAPDGFEKLEYINVKSESNGTAAADWKIESIGAEQVSGELKGDKFSITVNQWDPNGVTMSFGRETGKSGTFEFDIKTQNKAGAGTDATIKIKLIGENGETNLVDVEPFINSYTPGNNFEKNDHDKGRITFEMPAGGIGKIMKIYVESSGGAASADWDLEYIDVTEILPDGTGQHVRFNKKCTIKKNSSKTLVEYDMVSSAVVKSSVNRELLEKLQMVGENSYLLTVDEPVTVTADALKLIKDNKITLTIEMKDNGGILYSVTFNGEKIKTCKDVTLGKDYEIKDKEAFVSFLNNSNIPEGTKLNLYLDKLGFTEKDSISHYVKDENGKWTISETKFTEDEIYQELEITDGTDFILKVEGSNKDESTTVDKDIVSTGNTDYVILVTLVISMCTLALVVFGVCRKKKD